MLFSALYLPAFAKTKEPEAEAQMWRLPQEMMLDWYRTTLADVHKQLARRDSERECAELETVSAELSNDMKQLQISLDKIYRRSRAAR